MPLAFVPPDGYRNTTDFPTKPASETAFRDSMQDLLDQMRDYINSSTPEKTTASITYYVRADGSDSNNGLANTAGGAFKTISKAISVIPQIMNHDITVNIADGTYVETVSILGFSGSGTLTIQGNTATPDNVKVGRLVVDRCMILLLVNGVRPTTIVDSGISVSRVLDVRLTSCKVIDTAAGQDGIVATSAIVSVTSCTITGRNRAILSTRNSRIWSTSNSGTGNVFGLFASGGDIIKNGTQPAGTTAEFEEGGGDIR